MKKGINQNMKVNGNLTITLTDENGTEKMVMHLNNLVVNVGKNFIASRMLGTTLNVMSHMAIGTGTVSPSLSDTTLGTEVGRVGLSSSTASGAVATYTATFPAGVGTGAITEAGIFNASSSGTILCRTTFLPINKSSSDVVAFTWNINLS